MHLYLRRHAAKASYQCTQSFAISLFHYIIIRNEPDDWYKERMTSIHAFDVVLKWVLFSFLKIYQYYILMAIYAGLLLSVIISALLHFWYFKACYGCTFPPRLLLAIIPKYNDKKVPNLNFWLAAHALASISADSEEMAAILLPLGTHQFIIRLYANFPAWPLFKNCFYLRQPACCQHNAKFHWHDYIIRLMIDTLKRRVSSLRYLQLSAYFRTPLATHRQRHLSSQMMIIIFAIYMPNCITMDTCIRFTYYY